MAEEEVNIRIKETREGSAIRDAERDLDALKRKQQQAGQQPAAAPKPAPKSARDEAPASPVAKESRPKKPLEYHSIEELERRYSERDATEAAQAEQKKKRGVKGEIARTKEAIVTTKLEEEQARAAGRTGEADALAKEIKELETAVALQQKLGVSQDEALGMARASVSAKSKISQQTQEELDRQKKISEEKKRQALHEKANINGIGRVMQFGQQAFSGGTPSMAGMINMGRGAAGAGGMIAGAAVATAVGAAVVTALRSHFAAEKADISVENRLNEERGRDIRGLKRQAGIFGSSSSMIASAVETKEEIESRIAHRGELKHQAKLSKFNPLRWMDDSFGTQNWKRGAGGLGWWKSDGARAVDENEERIKDLETRRRKQRREARQKFLEEEGGLEMNIARNRAKHNLPGLREARISEGALIFMNEYKRGVSQHGDDALAKESADTKVKEWERDLRLRAAGGMVDARSGAGDIARAAEIGSMAMPDQDKLYKSIDAMHQTLKAKLGDIYETSSRHHFSE